MKWIIALLVLSITAVPFAQYGKPVTPEVEKKNIQVLIQKKAKAKTAFQKLPKDAKVKKAYVDANVALGLQYTFAGTVDRKVKYKLALENFREALKWDPQNKEAREMQDQIVAIYKSMGRPVPGGG